MEVRIEGGQGTGLDIEAELEAFDGFAIVHTATTARIGDVVATLVEGDVPIWEGPLRLVPSPERMDEVRRARSIATADFRSARRLLRELQDNEDPLRRFAGYLVEGRMLWSSSATSATSAEAVWRAGSKDDLLRSQLPRAAVSLSGSALFLMLEAGALDEAELLLERELPWWRDVGGRTARLFPRFMRARLAVHRGEVAAAFREIRALVDASDREGALRFGITALNLLSRQQLAFGRYHDALRTNRRLLSKPLRLRHHALAEFNTDWFVLWGREAGAFDMTDEALAQRFRAHLARFEQAGVAADRATARAALAYVSLARDDVGAAVEWMARVPLHESENLGQDRWFIRLVAAEVDLRRGEIDAAEAALEQIRADLEKEVRNRSAHQVWAARLLAEVSLARGDDARAAKQLERAWSESLEAARNLGLIGAANHYLQGQRDLPILLAQARLRSGDRLGAAAVIEQALYEGRAQVLALGAVEDRPGLWAPVEAARVSLREAQAEDCAPRSPAARRICETKRAHAEDDYRAAQMALFEGLEVPARGDVRGDLAALQAELSSKSGVLIGLRSKRRGIAALLTKSAVHVATSTRALAGLAGPLSRLESVAVAGDFDLVSAVDPKDAEGRPWGARLAVRRGPSAVWTARARPKGASQPPAVFADPRGDLTAARAGTATLAARWQVRPKLGAEATRAALLSALDGRRSLVLLSSHAEELELDRSSGRLLLSDGALDMQDILTRNLSAGLVVLNGCQSGGSARGYGVGLAEALLLEGSGAVLATVAPVGDAESTRFLGRFFAAGGREDPRSAYRAAVAASVKAGDDVWRRYRLWAR